MHRGELKPRPERADVQTPGRVPAHVFRNSEREPVDPIPYLVVTGMAFLGSYSVLLVYCLSLGTGTAVGVAVATAVFAGLAGVSYHRMCGPPGPDAG